MVSVKVKIDASRVLKNHAKKFQHRKKAKDIKRAMWKRITFYNVLII